jgi:putative cofactor-binding repeat protein
VTRKKTPVEAVNEIRNNNNGQVVLVLQGGGALGASQGGVPQALYEAGEAVVRGNLIENSKRAFLSRLGNGIHILTH